MMILSISQCSLTHFQNVVFKEPLHTHNQCTHHKTHLLFVHSRVPGRYDCVHVWFICTAKPNFLFVDNWNLPSTQVVFSSARFSILYAQMRRLFASFVRII